MKLLFVLMLTGLSCDMSTAYTVKKHGYNAKEKCFDGVSYLVVNSMGTAMSVKYNPDGSIATCGVGVE